MKLINLNRVLFLLVGLFLVASCGKDDDTGGTTPTGDAPVASFQFEISADDFSQVTFSNFSTNASSYAWDFGDGMNSTDENPVHTYAAGGTYDVTLTASSADDSATSTKSITIVDPNEAIKALTGDVSKTWKLYREGTCLSLGPDATNPAGWWAGLQNNGARPCVYEQTFTFHLDGSFVFDDMGLFWGENDPWNGTANHETCFEPTAANMVNLDGADVSAWASGTHQFSYDPSVGQMTLTGMGAWMGLVQTVGLPDLYSNVPTASRTFNATITQEAGYDILNIAYDYGADGLWSCVYVSYSDASLEPAVVTDAVVFGEDLPNITPAELSHTFASAEDFVLLSPVESVAQIAVGVDDPAGSATKVGQYDRTTDLYQELKMQTSPDLSDIDFASMTTVSLEVYLPSTNDYDSELDKSVIIGLADASATEQWWTDNREYTADGTGIELDQWVTLTYNLDSPNAGAGTYTPYDRDDLDMIYISIGGGGHPVAATFYVRNLKFN